MAVATLLNEASYVGIFNGGFAPTSDKTSIIRR